MAGTETVTTPPRFIPLLHLLLAGFAVLILHVPVVRLREMPDLSIAAISPHWSMASLVLLAILMLAALLICALNRCTWQRLLLLDLGVILALIPAVIGLVVDWTAPAGGIDGLAWGFWLAVALLALRMPLTLWVRSHAARVG